MRDDVIAHPLLRVPSGATTFESLQLKNAAETRQGGGPFVIQLTATSGISCSLNERPAMKGATSFFETQC